MASNEVTWVVSINSYDCKFRVEAVGKFLCINVNNKNAKLIGMPYCMKNACPLVIA